MSAKGLSRRMMLQNSAAVTLGFAGLKWTESWPSSKPAVVEHKPDPEKLFDLPPGFSYQVVSRFGQMMDDGFRTPGKADGMCAFPGPDGKTILVRNHELTDADKGEGPFGSENELFGRLDRSLIYDACYGKEPCLGGTTTILYDTQRKRRELVFLSLVGTLRNCAGGPTPWNTWISCEENVQRAFGEFEKDHGYNFEVPTRLSGGVIRPEPLRAMGRFYHEAIACDPRSGIIYQTEDRDNGLIYRFMPDSPGRDGKPGKLLAGGKLQALRVKGQSGLDTRNWSKNHPTIHVGDAFDVEWVDVEDVESPDDEIRNWGFHVKGCTRFARAEGMWFGRDAVYFACTTGGSKHRGQIWRYTPSQYEGTSDEQQTPGRLELFIEPNNSTIAENADNITMAPWGDVFICEDHDGRRSSPEQYLLRVTPWGQVSRFGRNALNSSELAGVTFSPDGSTLFVNIYTPGITLAITGPWEKGGMVLG